MGFTVATSVAIAADLGPRQYTHDDFDGEVSSYVVATGDGLSNIAQRFELSVEALKAHNKLSSDIIQVGDKLTFNTMFNEARVFTYKDTAIVTPNSDTPYSMVWLDLRAEPIVISVPAVPEKRYYSVQLIDGNTYNFGYIGTSATGPDAGEYLVVGPDWKGEKPAVIKAAVLLAMKEGDDKIDRYLTTAQKSANGWKIGSLFGDRQFFNGNWLDRAAAAKAGIYGNDSVEAAYPMTRVDTEGDILDGSKHNYTLTFASEQLPPVNAFWSVTMYDGQTQLLIENPINRSLINSPMLPELKKGDDGSLTLYIEKDSPGAGKESNWLPAPDGPIYLVIRLYWPKTEPPSVLPAGEGIWSPPGIVKAD